MKKEYVNIIKRENICDICFENPKNIILKCKHSFCNICIEKWKKTHNSCPICRNTLNNYMITPENKVHYINCLLNFYNHPDIYLDYIKKIQSDEKLFIWNLLEKRKKLDELSIKHKQKIFKFIINICQEQLDYTDDHFKALQIISKVDLIIANGFLSIKKVDHSINTNFDSLNKFIYCFETM